MMINDKGDKVLRKPSESLLSKYQINLQTAMKGSNFIFDCVDLLH